MPTPLAELFTTAALAALEESRNRSEVIKAQLRAICEAHGLRATLETLDQLPEPALTVAQRLAAEFKAWTEAGYKAHMMIADLRRDVLR